ncbi:MAG: hypothetical protein M0R47_01255 [Methylobacter sp.]|uniref:hypothetical protein n=1 Tax=Methylobacter sp. TaxID=2051955 RepID=UPI0025D35548|nr:hypothetical protein [Methylobacter sp.]MCK9619142.1 hypothetical protein [Methylobacter sp.]
MKVKTKKNTMTIKSQKADHYRKLIANDVPTKARTDSWIKELLDNDGTKGSKQDALKVMDYLKEEMAYLKKYQSNASTCRLNLRMAVHFFDQGGYDLLGHASLKVCLETELPKAKSLSTLYREVKAAQLEVILFGEGKIGTVRESVLRPLSKFGDDKKQIKKAWKKAMKEKSESLDFPTAKLVAKAVRDLLSGEREEDTRWSKHSATDIAEKIVPKLATMMDKYDGNVTEKRIHAVLDLIEEHLFEEFNLEDAS